MVIELPDAFNLINICIPKFNNNKKKKTNYNEKQKQIKRKDNNNKLNNH